MVSCSACDWRAHKVLDIAAGHGMFGIAVGKVIPQAQIVAVDWKPVLTVAKENAKKAEIDDRYETIAGSAFEVDFGLNYDLVLLPNFLHHFDEETCVELLKKVKQSLSAGGEDETGPICCRSSKILTRSF